MARVAVLPPRHTGRAPRRPLAPSPTKSSQPLREYQLKNSPGGPAGAKKKRKIKNGSSPETTTSGDCPSPEDVSLA
ncbi:hypothetical protein FD755_008630 [Muntiacus reevesi]|uniref:Uncharacterized protein n=2 Tax=Muntiacus TaxID=9885 RepID=A0A5J5MKH0_MUNRE|nr:hypothetical protein FD754_000819 [Muntiacus muntjak]KAB0380846.1 hypothetical protein FD755_008630 [Muntiacus reevesi]